MYTQYNCVYTNDVAKYASLLSPHRAGAPLMTCSPLRGLRTSLAWRNAPENNLNYLEALRQAPAR